MRNLLIITTLGLSFGLQAQGDLSRQIQSKLDSIQQLESKIAQIQMSLEDLKLAKIREDLRQNGLPKVQAGEEIVEHLAMMLVYSEQHEQAKWVAHIIHPDMRFGREGRTNDFRPDPLIKTGSAVELDYFIKTQKSDGSYAYDGFGYDRGHLAPSADFRWSNRALSESYFYSNMSPQLGDFNRDSWAKLEDMLRGYIYRYPETQLYVVTGPVLRDDLPKIPRAVNKVSIPTEYFKLAVDLTNKRAIAFVMPNKKADNPHAYYAKSIDEVEQLTGIDFFAALPDEVENALEAQKDPLLFLPPTEQEDVLPIAIEDLPKNCYNTLQAKEFAQVGSKQKFTVCGTVVSTKLSSKGNIFLNLDKKFPNQIFSVTIFKDNVVNFEYAPEEFLMGKKICVKGVITDFNGVASMVIENGKAIEILEE